jgi:hypothetical protein
MKSVNNEVHFKREPSAIVHITCNNIFLISPNIKF